MKKILATVLALTMIVGMSITAFAATQNFNAVGTSQDIDVNATYEKKDATTDTTPVYSVNITWTEISFTFTEAANVKTWNPANLAYEVSTTNTNGAWSGETATIAIENRSNAAVTVTPTWQGTVEGVMPVISGAVQLDAATEGADAGVTGEITVAAPTTGTITKAQEGKIGTITLTITAA